MNPSKLMAATIAVGILLTDTVMADVYKWIDSEGRVHYSDKAPAGVESKSLQPTPPVDLDEAARQRERLERTEEELEQRMRERHAGSAAKSVEKSRRTELRKGCLALRRELDILDSGRPVYRGEESEFRAQWLHDPYRGKRQYLDENERNTEIKRVRDEISANCGDPDDPKARRLAREQQVRAEWCEAARADLELLLQRRSRTTDDTLRAQRRAVAHYCDE